MTIYKTISGDTWDMIAKKVYGSESYTYFLMGNNLDKLDYFVFPQGVELKILELTESEIDNRFPDWRN